MNQLNNTADEDGPHRLTSSINLPSIYPVLLTSDIVDGSWEGSQFKISSANVHVFGLWEETPAHLLPANHDFNSHEICSWLLWAQQTSDERSPAGFEYLSIWYFFGFGTFCCSYSSTCLWYSVNIFPENFSTNALPGLLPLKPKAFPESTLDPSSSMRSRSGLSWSLHHCLCSSWIPLPQEVPAIVTRLFNLMANSTKTQSSEKTWIDYSLLLDSNANFKHVILLSHGVTS